MFAPYFPPEDPHKFAIVHKVFGASNVSKMLQVRLSVLFCPVLLFTKSMPPAPHPLIVHNLRSCLHIRGWMR
jgi:hypothetical protein